MGGREGVWVRTMRRRRHFSGIAPFKVAMMEMEAWHNPQVLFDVDGSWTYGSCPRVARVGGVFIRTLPKPPSLM
jgi:hypothetical protein